MGGVEMDQKTWDEIMADCDTNKDGQVNYLNSFYFLILLDLSK